MATATFNLINYTAYSGEPDSGTSYDALLGTSASNTDNTYSMRWTIPSAAGSRNYAFMRFNSYEIPSTATDISISCKVAAWTGDQTAVSEAYVQLCHGSDTTRLKGTSRSLQNGETTAFTITDCGTWTAEELKDCYLYITVARNTNTSTAIGARIRGATLTVTYTDNTSVNRTVSTNVSGGTISPSFTSIADRAGKALELRSTNGNTLTRLCINGASVLGDASYHTSLTKSSSTYSVDSVSGASYGFALNTNGYYESKNKGVSASAAVCKVTFDLKTTSTITFSCINYAESNFDFGLLSKVDKTLKTGYSIDTSNVYKSFKGSSSSSVQKVTYSNVSAGSHYIYVKYRKDDSVNEHNDTLQFKVAISPDSVTVSDPYYLYELTDIMVDTNINAEFTTDTATCIATVSANVSDDLYKCYIIDPVCCDTDTSMLAQAIEYARQGVLPETFNLVVPRHVHAGQELEGEIRLIIVPIEKQKVKKLTGTGEILGNLPTYINTTDISGGYAWYGNERYGILNLSGETAATIELLIGSEELKLKQNGEWITIQKVFKKINGVWVEQTELDGLFDPEANYVNDK